MDPKCYAFTRYLIIAVMIVAVGGYVDVAAKPAAGVFLMEAIDESAAQVAMKIPVNGRVVIAAFETGDGRLTEYMMEKLTGALIDRNIEVADWRNMDYVYKQLSLQKTDKINSKTIKLIGKFLAADMVITGQLINSNRGDMYRYRTDAYHAGNAARAGTVRLDVISDATMKRTLSTLADQKERVQARHGVSRRKTPQTAGAFLDRGIIFYRRGEYNNAISNFSNALKIDPKMAVAYYNRGTAYVEKHDFDLAITDFDRAIQLDPNSFYAYARRGNAYYLKGNADKAIADFKSALKINSKYPYAKQSLEDILRSKK